MARYTFVMWDAARGRFEIEGSAQSLFDAIVQADNWARATRENTGAQVWAITVRRGWDNAPAQPTA